MIPAEAVEAAALALIDVDPLWPDGAWETMPEEVREHARGMVGAILEAAAPHMLAARTEIGYVCRHGHFQFNEDPDGDACGTKIVGRVYVEAEPEITPEELADAIGYSLESHHRKMEEWRKL